MIKLVKVHLLSGRAIALWLLALKMQMDRLWVSRTLPPSPAEIRLRNLAHSSDLPK